MKVAEFFDYNPHTGTWYEHEIHHATGEGAITIKQDSEPVLDFCRDARNSGLNDKFEHFGHYAVIPAWLQVELMRKGVWKDTSKLIKEIETNYPRFKVTNLKHHVRAYGA